MGTGIAYVFAAAGCAVTLIEPSSLAAAGRGAAICAARSRWRWARLRTSGRVRTMVSSRMTWARSLSRRMITRRPAC
ncbi:hypothetical protein [Pseudonocardia acidicola]|nr:hypothetical protein [Pseudonocardia acidicola]